MNRYVLRFCKYGNMRFLSHLDLGRLFKRAVRRANVKIAFSNGYNPHELMNIVQPLSLGYESDSEYLEIDTLIPYDPDTLAQSLCQVLPEGIRFTACREEERTSKNLSFYTQRALYEAFFPLTEADAEKADMQGFMDQERVIIIKRDKKTKKPVEKDIKDWIYSFTIKDISEGQCRADMSLRCASNETANPGKLLESFFGFCGISTKIEDCRITRKDILALNGEGQLVSAYEAR
ncbi:MAG: DUF2344 domain-containing protein [Firmicutes bacterium]|nr:DUF2344 domain-containing protein [Bacillota bacterium]